MSLFSRHLYLSTILTLSLGLLTACGSGGGSDDQAGQTPSIFQNITFSDLGSSLTFDENEQVILSLNTQNPSNAALTYDWSVSDGVMFTGQNTDTIRFIAPDIDDPIESLSVSVEIDLVDGRLLGENRQSITIFVMDTNNPLTDVRRITTDSFLQDLPEVEAFDLAQENLQGTWVIESYAEQVTSSDVIKLGIIEQLYVTQEVGQPYSVRPCGFPISGDLSTLTFSLTLERTEDRICNSPIETKLFQTDNIINVKHFCDSVLIRSHQLSRVSADILDRSSALDLRFDNIERLDTNQDVCVNTARGIVSFASNPEQFESTIYVITAPYVDDRLTLTLSSDGIARGLDFGSLGTDQLNTLTLESDTLGALSNVEASMGRFRVNTSGIINVEGNFDASIENEEGTLEQVEGDFSLDLPEPL